MQRLVNRIFDPEQELADAITRAAEDENVTDTLDGLAELLRLVQDDSEFTGTINALRDLSAKASRKNGGRL